MHINTNGSIKSIGGAYTNVDGTIKNIADIWTNQNGIIKQLWPKESGAAAPLEYFSILFRATVGSNVLHVRNVSNGNSITIDWGDTTTSTFVGHGGNLSHTYSQGGDYNIKITGVRFAGIHVNNQTGREKYKALYGMGKWQTVTMTDLSSAFHGCNQLEYIADNAFYYCTRVTGAFRLFSGCTNLTHVGKDAFYGFSEVLNADQLFFGCASLEELPAGIFDTMGKVTRMINTFRGVGLKTLPNDLFRHTTSVTTFSHSFVLCPYLEELPANLFKYNSAVTSYSNTFLNSPKVILRTDLFGENFNNFSGKSMDFRTFISRASFTGSRAGTAPRIWNTPFTSVQSAGAFGGTGNTTASISNHSEIPGSWR